MQNAAEFAASFPKPQTILGLRLRPFSIGRYRILQRFKSPFVSDSQVSLPLKQMNQELFFALAVCGLRCDEFNTLLESDKLQKQFGKWGKLIRKISSRGGFSIIEHIKIFEKFLAESSELPWVVVESGNSLESSVTHWSTSLEVILRSKMGWTEEEINERPMIQGLTYYFKYMESEGSVRLYSHEQHAELLQTGRENAEALNRILSNVAQS